MLYITFPFCTRREAPKKKPNPQKQTNKKETKKPRTLILIYESEENYFLPKSNLIILG